MCTEGPERIRELIIMGASFGHRQIVRADNMRVREIEKALIRGNYF